jgi:hypothetical protein
MGCAVIRICYEDFSAGTHDVTGGLHGKAECCARGVTVYLVPGITACQRRAVIRRLRQEASRGLSPELPLPQLAVALGLAWVRSAARIASGMVRLHPAVTLLPGAFVVALMALFVVVSADRPGIAPTPGLSGAEAAARGRVGPPVAGSADSRVLPYVVATTDGGGRAIGSEPHHGTVLPVVAVAAADNDTRRHRDRHPAGPHAPHGPGVLAGQSLTRRPLAGLRWSTDWYACPHGQPASRRRASSRGSAWAAASPGRGWAAARSRGGWHACRRWKTGAMLATPPYTTHFPGPRALAW